ncbi:MAG: hypothetical protein ACTSXQ_01760 [Alphaproteobacteria bacterium]
MEATKYLKKAIVFIYETGNKTGQAILLPLFAKKDSDEIDFQKSEETIQKIEFTVPVSQLDIQIILNKEENLVPVFFPFQDITFLKPVQNNGFPEPAKKAAIQFLSDLEK